MRTFCCSGLLYLLALNPITGWAAPQKPCKYKVKESIAPPNGWVKHTTPPADHNIVLRIGLPQPDFHVLEQHLYEVSDPYHPRYGAHLSKEEVDRLVAPHQGSVDAVNEWLSSHGITEGGLSRSSAGDWVTLKLPVRLVEEMLNTTYHVWKHDNGDRIVRTTSYSLPEDLHDHIDLIQPTTMFGQFKELKSTIVFSDDTEAPAQFKNLAPIVNAATGVPVDASCNATITIKCLQQLYNAVGFTPTHAGNSIGITGYLEQFANIQDLQSFYADQRPDALGSSFEFISVKGGLNNQTLSEAGAEANLDVQFAFGLSHPIPGTFYSTAGRPPFDPDVGTPTNTNEPYQDWLDFILSHPNPPLSISTSYGDHEQTVPKSYAQRACKSFAQLGARGVSLMFSSGDGGVGDNNPNPATQKCFTNDGRNATRFIPLFPASCPFVTSVGGTVGVPEVAVSRFFSGGGFSDYFARPKYQDKVVRKYLEALPKGTYKGLFNRNGRGIPDVAAQGDRYRIFLSGQARLIGGTSASSPTFAGIVALLNDVRLSNGQPPLGFLNPLLYSKAASGFNDITVGHNSGCGTTGFNKDGIQVTGIQSFTGLGTPNFGKLKKLVS
ncbi:hypothetical protein D9615_000690 [Tricholomella constricta]|uniref:tripeptidyl-peptidase II n=1 Tax=Tricholomella constricta TaxID=117010 RepID=A0A8H5HS33_9AGAR|nr:hypothetical protein D9615_000690 [Tricholomella constricta]